jgi:hypothetical protein
MIHPFSARGKEMCGKGDVEDEEAVGRKMWEFTLGERRHTIVKQVEMGD